MYAESTWIGISLPPTVKVSAAIRLVNEAESPFMPFILAIFASSLVA